MTNWAAVARHRPDLHHLLKARIEGLEKGKTPAAVLADTSDEGETNPYNKKQEN